MAEARLVLKLAQRAGLVSTGTRLHSGGSPRVCTSSTTWTGEDAARVRADLYGLYGWFCQEAGHHTRAIEWCTRAIAEAEAVGELPALAEALRISDWAKMQLGQLGEPRDTERALAIYEELADLHGQSATTNMLGMVAYWWGDWATALDYYERSLVLAQRAGNPIKVAFQLYNIGEMFVDQGKFDEAAEMLGDAAREWRAAGYRSGVAATAAVLARVAAGRGALDDALGLIEQAIEGFRAIGSHAEVLEARARLAEILQLSGDPDGARTVAEDAIAQARGFGGVSEQLPLLHRVRGAALARTGDDEAAAGALADSLEVARHRDAEHDVALTLRTMARFARDRGDPGAGALERDADAVLARLGVESTLDLLADDGQPRTVAVSIPN